MRKFKDLLNAYPFGMVLFTIFSGMAFLVLGDMSASMIFEKSSESWYQCLSRCLLGTAFLTFLVRAGWGKKAGVTCWFTSGKKYWWTAFLPLSFFLLANLSSWDWSSFQFTPGSVLGWISMNFAVGFVEEVMYRGFALFILLEAWGKTKKGILAACLVQALLFGPFHLLNLLSGDLLSYVVTNAVFATIVGIAFGAAYAYSGSLWTCILLHTAIDLAGNGNEAFTNVEKVVDSNPTPSNFIASLVIVVVVSLLPSLWFILRADLRS